MLTISPADTRKLIQSVRLEYNHDLSAFCFNLLRYRVSLYLDQYRVEGIGHLLDHLLEDETAMDKFLSCISAGSSELFRDPVMWKHLREQFIPEIISENRQPVFWFPRSVSGHDAFSLLILLAEDRIRYPYRIILSTSNFTDMQNIQAGILNREFMNLSRENYVKAGGRKSLDEYVDRNGNLSKLNPTRKITFSRHFNMLHGGPGQVDLIMIRNQLINYKQQEKNKLLNHFTEILKPGGILVLGVKERIEDKMVERKVVPQVGHEGIYRKMMQKPDTLS